MTETGHPEGCFCQICIPGDPRLPSRRPICPDCGCEQGVDAPKHKNGCTAVMSLIDGDIIEVGMIPEVEGGIYE